MANVTTSTHFSIDSTGTLTNPSAGRRLKIQGIYYSGAGTAGNPGVVLRDDATDVELFRAIMSGATIGTNVGITFPTGLWLRGNLECSLISAGSLCYVYFAEN